MSKEQGSEHSDKEPMSLPELKLPNLSHLKLPRVEVVSTRGDLEQAILGFCRDEIAYEKATAESLAEWLTVVAKKVSEL